MNDTDFTGFFWNVFDTMIPSDARKEISNYWRIFKVAPTFELDDRCIDAIFGHDTQVAAVRTFPCRYHFAFRSFVVMHAPLPIARTIIQHELIHCFLDKDSTPQKVFSKRFREMDKPYFAEISRLEAKMQKILVYSAEEELVNLINKRWGGDDNEAWNWCLQYIR